MQFLVSITRFLRKKKEDCTPNLYKIENKLGFLTK